MGKHLLIGSIVPYSGKSATIIGLAKLCRDRHLRIAYGKPLGTYQPASDSEETEADVSFLQETLNLENVRPTLLTLTPEAIKGRLTGTDQQDYRQALAAYHHINSEDLVLLEGPATLAEGRLFDLDLAQMAAVLEAPILLVVRYESPLVVESLLLAKSELGDRLLGVIINDIPATETQPLPAIRQYLEAHQIPVFGTLPRSQLLRSVSVKELVRQLNAEVLCRPDRLDLLVEELTIGAMNVSAALKYFRKANNMAVITGGDRTDIQWAALETSTHCLILTGHLPPSPAILARAEELEIPILSVDLDTLTAVEIVDRAFGQVRLHEIAKVKCVEQMMQEHVDGDRLLTQLGLLTVEA
ncbi:BioD-like N-terminal domain of phosphotransacetylase [Thermosynechococcus sp. NK55a]|uniref:phosphotransacetylase family protein n=1 Tax=unclassified Thermosynechococcus TaxID=2622553 RepID=UPI0003D92478|nr:MULTISPECIES: phosphotransacetylase family protein [unclassified Thermosynechococcus]AHB88660.1 BioD-like N-terminal domain of phosphotransacetylase [Thermosynechococcus sp. NK55a]RMH66019.1 MAG: phosphotransacetylase family protein [Cyanobacteria bacterium J003]HIK22595.1 phosphotransacetylase family protein [Thermosynechococcus sp. M3746_W2019_013]